MVFFNYINNYSNKYWDWVSYLLFILCVLFSMFNSWTNILYLYLCCVICYCRVFCIFCIFVFYNKLKNPIRIVIFSYTTSPGTFLAPTLVKYAVSLMIDQRLLTGHIPSHEMYSPSTCIPYLCAHHLQD